MTKLLKDVLGKDPQTIFGVIDDIDAHSWGVGGDTVTLLRSEISHELFDRQEGYSVMPALSEAGAHVEYLHELGYLTIDNLDEVTLDLTAAPRYRARPRSPHPLLRRTSLPVRSHPPATDA